MNETIVEYGDFDFNNQPTPFVTRSENFIKAGENWGTSETFALRGQLTGCNFNALRSGQLALISGFGQDFQDFNISQVTGDGFPPKNLLNKSGIKVESINFDSNNYNKILPYTVTLTHYPPEYFKTYDGVVSPVDSWAFDEAQDGLLNITHTISCKGFNTSSQDSNAFDNARNFVYSRTGYQNMINPHFICKNTYPEFYPCLDTFSENIDRINGTYSITENYISDLEGSGKGVFRYTVDVNSGISDFSTATIQGNIDACKSQDISVARARFKEINFFDLASDVYNDAFGFVDLDRNALTSGIGEDRINKKIDFNIQWDNDHSPSTVLDVTTNISSGDSIITVGVNGNLRAKGDVRGRYQTMLETYSGIDIFTLANDAYINYLDGDVSYPLNPSARSSGSMKDQFTPAITFRATFNNEDIPPSGFESFTRNVSVKPSLRSLKPVSRFDQNGDYTIMDLLFDKRAKLSVSINAIGNVGEDPNGLVQIIKDEGNLLLQNYGKLDDLKLESYNISTGNKLNYGLSASWTFETDNKIFNGTNYDQVNTFKIK